MSALREVVAAAKAEHQALVVPGATDAITARVIEQLGFAAVYVTGAGLANARFGYPDIGLVGMSEVVDHVAAIAESIDIPLIVDADTGYGNALNVQRAVRLLERAGAAAIQIEDQVAPKRCGHFDGKEVIEAEEMVQKVRAAVDARRSDTLIIARTDAAAVSGIDEALERAHRYREAGADVLFIEAPTSRDDLARIPQEVPGTHVVNMVEGGRTPLMGQQELAALGFTLIVYANSAMRAAVFGVRAVLQHLRDEGSTVGVSGQLITWEERQALVQKPRYDALEATYRAKE
ncbi:MAG: isocitrate lyase/PEP mutase family protein [Actinomycetota bacterium]|jgi:2-methylisocitrate lyase-like PEP mutase family enzyme|nr:isocitrate lyase/PEP mutase family protein [Actinomycetota bacterium]MDA8279365.1 isocitrate lyase/PEP mutase family protein [Actinomycetota bacterium]